MVKMILKILSAKGEPFPERVKIDVPEGYKIASFRDNTLSFVKIKKSNFGGNYESIYLPEIPKANQTEKWVCDDCGKDKILCYKGVYHGKRIKLQGYKVAVEEEAHMGFILHHYYLETYIHRRTGEKRQFYCYDGVSLRDCDFALSGAEQYILETWDDKCPTCQGIPTRKTEVISVEVIDNNFKIIRKELNDPSK